MRIEKYDITSDGKHQFIMTEVKINTTIKDGVKGKNYGEEQLINPTYHMSWGGVVDKLIKLELMTAVKDLSGIADVIQRFELSMLNLEEEVKQQLSAEALGEK